MKNLSTCNLSHTPFLVTVLMGKGQKGAKTETRTLVTGFLCGFPYTGRMANGHGKKKPAQTRDRFDRFSYLEGVA